MLAVPIVRLQPPYVSTCHVLRSRRMILGSLRVPYGLVWNGTKTLSGFLEYASIVPMTIPGLISEIFQAVFTLALGLRANIAHLVGVQKCRGRAVCRCGGHDVVCVLGQPIQHSLSKHAQLVQLLILHWPEHCLPEAMECVVIVLFPTFIVPDNALRHFKVEQVGVDTWIVLNYSVPSLGLCPFHFVVVSTLGTVEEGAVACSTASGPVVEMCIVARLGAHIALYISAALASASHFVATILSNEWGATCMLALVAAA